MRQASSSTIYIVRHFHVCFGCRPRCRCDGICKKTKLLLFEFINQDRHMCTCLIFISSIFCNSFKFCVDSSLDLKIHFSVAGIYKNSRIIVKVNKCWRKNDNRIILYELQGGLSREKKLVLSFLTQQHSHKCTKANTLCIKFHYFL